MLARVDSGNWPTDRLLETIGEVRTRPEDRALFELPPGSHNMAGQA
jgi:hypothetical protein